MLSDINKCFTANIITYSGPNYLSFSFFLCVMDSAYSITSSDIGEPPPLLTSLYGTDTANKRRLKVI